MTCISTAVIQLELIVKANYYYYFSLGYGSFTYTDAT